MQGKICKFEFDMEKNYLLQKMAKIGDAHAPPVEKKSPPLRLNDCFALSGMTKIMASILADLSISGVCFEISLYIFITYFFSMTNKDKKK